MLIVYRWSIAGQVRLKMNKLFEQRNSHYWLKYPVCLNTRNKKPPNLPPRAHEVTAVTGAVHPVITTGLQAKDVLC